MIFLLLGGTLFAQGSQLALTPPMGWNSWYAYRCKVTEAIVRAQADAMVSNGMKAAGYEFVNIDDCWAGKRDAAGFIHPNERFSDMKALGDYIHSKGLKFGLYSSPEVKTCTGLEGSLGHEEQDAQSYSDWGADFLKYDNCRATQDKIVAYERMHQAIMKTGRPMVYLLCLSTDMDRVWAWGTSVGGNLWRTTSDIQDKWESMALAGFGQNGLERFAGPGHWNDPDMLVLGKVGWGHLHPTRLTPNEQYTHVSLWCLLTGPLLIGCDMTAMDDFTVSLLSNDEVLAVSQDPLGRQAGRIIKQDNLEIWAKDMSDGSKAVGLFNRNNAETNVVAKWSDLGISGSRMVRDLWRQRDIGKFSGQFESAVPRHGVVLVKVEAVAPSARQKQAAAHGGQ
jgi:alpha-galactosidase